MKEHAEATQSRHCDVLVIGGGPAESTVVPQLARPKALILCFA